MAERRGHAVWHGNLLEGSGTVDAASGAVSSQEVTWKARTEGSDTVTSPEELIAAAEAACFAMALSHALVSPKPRQAAPLRLRCAATSRSTCAAGSRS